MISAPDRQEAIRLIAEAVGAGARQARVCAVLSLSARTVQRWRHRPQDSRPGAQRNPPANTLTTGERAVLEAANRLGYA